MTSADKRCPLCASVFCLRADPERCRHTGQRRPVAQASAEATTEAPTPSEVPAAEPPDADESADVGESEEAAPEPVPIVLEDLTVPQLRELAKEREIHIDSRATKAELIEALS